MPRLLLLILLLAPGCSRRELASGSWTGVVRPDAGASSPAGPKEDKSGTVSKAPDAAPPPPDAASAGALVAPDAAGARGSEGPGAAEPVARFLDGGADVGDARSCPESGQCD
jgi:hypothetical protein